MSYLTLASPFNLLSTSSLSPFAAACTFASSFSPISKAAANTRSTSVYGIMTTFDRLLGNSSGGVDYPSDALLQDKGKTYITQHLPSPGNSFPDPAISNGPPNPGLCISLHLHMNQPTGHLPTRLLIRIDLKQSLCDDLTVFEIGLLGVVSFE